MGDGVSSGVCSIVASFINGLNVLNKLREKHKRKKQITSRSDYDSNRLSKSLQQGSQEITTEYERGMRLGDRYAHGDSIAQHSLAAILLKLNTGLVSIIASFLNRDREYACDYGSFMHLSESSRKDSVNVLRQLYQRVATRQVPAQVKHNGRSHKQTSRVGPKQTKIRGPTIARVIVENSSKLPELAVVKPKKKPSSSTSSLTKGGSYSSSITAVASIIDGRPPQHRANPSSDLSKGRKIKEQTQRAHLSRSSPHLPLPQRSQLSKSSPNLLFPTYTEQDDPQTMPPLPTIRRRPQPNPRRKDMPSMYSIATDSTKLGEIPSHKWAVPYDFDNMSMLNQEAMQSGWPLTDLSGNAAFKPKKRFGLFRLFKKKETTV